MKAYSVDVREKVLRAVDQGYPREEIVKLLSLFCQIGRAA
jgi:hypothetical protein